MPFCSLLIGYGIRWYNWKKHSSGPRARLFQHFLLDLSWSTDCLHFIVEHRVCHWINYHKTYEFCISKHCNISHWRKSYTRVPRISPSLLLRSLVNFVLNISGRSTNPSNNEPICQIKSVKLEMMKFVPQITLILTQLNNKPIPMGFVVIK